MDLQARAQPVIDIIYEAALRPDPGGTRLVEALSRAFDGAAVLLNVNLPRSTSPRIYSVGLLESYARNMVQAGLTGLPLSSAVGSRFRGSFTSLRDAFPDLDLQDTGFFRDWMEPQGLPPVWPVATTLQLLQGDSAGGLVLYQRNRPLPFGREDLELGQLLVPHLNRAVSFTNLRVNQGDDRERIAFAGMIDRLPMGIALLDSRGKLVRANKVAHRILALNDGLVVAADGLRAVKPLQTAILNSFIADALKARPGRELDMERSIQVSRPSGKPSFTVTITPMLSESDSTKKASDPAAVMMMISDLEVPRVSDIESLQATFSLAEREAEIVNLISKGRCVDEAAQELGIERGEAREILENVLRGIDPNEEGQLIHLLLSGPQSDQLH